MGRIIGGGGRVVSGVPSNGVTWNDGVTWNKKSFTSSCHCSANNYIKNKIYTVLESCQKIQLALPYGGKWFSIILRPYKFH